MNVQIKVYEPHDNLKWRLKVMLTDINEAKQFIASDMLVELSAGEFRALAEGCLRAADALDRAQKDAA